MKAIVTITLNPAIDKNSSIDPVVAERKLCCKPSLFRARRGRVNVSRAIKKLGGKSLLLYPAGRLTRRLS
jgi:6-phosphofructokinase 2